MKTRSLASVLGTAAFALLVLITLIYTVFPFYWALSNSFKPELQITAVPAQYIPLEPTAEHYRQVLRRRDFVEALKSSLIVAGGTTLLALGVGTLAACALGRYRMRGRQAVLAVILSMTLFPQISVVGSIRETVQALHLMDSHLGLMLSYLLFTLPFTVWVLTGFFQSLPKELEESAYVDGASPLQTFWRILLPLSLPGLATTCLLAFIAAWNEYLFALALTTSDARTVPVVIANFGGSSHFSIPWGSIMAACVLVTLPLVLLVLLFQRFIISGMTSGAVKG